MGQKCFYMVGQKYGRLEVLAISPRKGEEAISWVCRCDCGNELIATGISLRTGNTKSCGCLMRETSGNRLRTHGMRHTPSYDSWRAMKERCNIPTNKAYSHYGGRGIKVCDRWDSSFESFYEDMGNRPKGTTLDRIDVDGDYTPENCKWSTVTEQRRNMRSNIVIPFRGKSLCVSEVAEKLEVPYDSCLYYIHKYGTEEGIRRCISRHGKAA